MANKTDWEIVGEPLGSGGQSEVFLVRTPARRYEVQSCIHDIIRALGKPLPGQNIVTQYSPEESAKNLANAISAYARPDLPSELGAMKVFKIRKGGAPAEQRLTTEITILQQNRPGLPKLLDSNQSEQWMVTEYFPGGTLEKHSLRYKGQVVLALTAFRSLVETVASLHKDKIVHRDIKPANVFVNADDILIPGDFGIAYLPDQAHRMTQQHERVGPWEYMPQWADVGERLEKVEPNFDVYMLGKLLWCMISGRSRLPREWHRRPEYDLGKVSPDNEHIPLINLILDKCLVDDPDRCLPSAQELLEVVNETLAILNRNMPLLIQEGKLNLQCRLCGRGSYQARTETLQVRNSSGHDTLLKIYICNVCTHFVFFAPGNPQEAAKRNWTPWTT